MNRILYLKFSLLLGFLMIVMLGHHVRNAYAQPVITLGVVPGTTELLTTAEQAGQLEAYLNPAVGFEVRVKSFREEDHLNDWLMRFREVDVALFSETYSRKLHAGQAFPLVAGEGPDGRRLNGLMVARPGVDALHLQRLVRVLTEMAESENGRSVLSMLEVGRFLVDSTYAASMADVAEVAAAPAAAQEPLPVVSTETPMTTGTMPQAESAVAQDGLPEVMPAVVKPAPVAGDPVPPQSEPVTPMAEKTAAAKGAGDQPMSLEADSLVYSKADDTYEARGGVSIQQGRTRLSADQVVWQTSTQDAAAEGQVSLADAQGILTSRSLQMNLATGQGKAADGHVHLKERNFHLLGDEIEKLGEATYRVAGGVFTTCDGEVPDWKFTAEHLDVTLGDYVKARNVWFHVKDVPLLYTPYLVYPVKNERESGFLSPWFGYSQNKGIRSSLAWYQVIDRNLDATIYLDYYSNIGVGKGLEYRYFLADDNTGRAFYYHVNGISDTPDMYGLQWEHGGTLPGDVWLSADVEYVDNKTFFDDFGEAAEDYNKDKTVSTVWAQRNWGKLNTVGMVRYIKDLDNDNDATLQRLPELGIAVPRYRLGTTPFYASLESYGTNFWREKGDEGQRLYLKPSLSASLLPGSWLEVVPQVALYERLYHADSGDEEMAVPEYSLTLSTRLEKVFSVDSDVLDKVQHSIEPQVNYSYVPESSQSDLPLFDINDRLPKRNLIDYQLINRFTGRFVSAAGKSDYREFAWLRLSQSYDIDEAREDNPDGPRQPFSELRAEVDIYPTRRSDLRFDSFIPVYGDTQFRRLRASGGFDDSKGNAASLSYNYRNGKLDIRAVDYLRFEADTSLLKPLFLHVEERYDFRKRRELEKFVGVEYRAKCWSLVLTYRERYRNDGADDREYMLNFVLAGLSPDERVGMSRAFAQKH